MKGGEHAGCGFGKDDVAPPRAVPEGARLPRRGRRLPEPLGGSARGDPRLRLRPRGVGHGQAQENEGRRTHPRGSRGVQAGIYESVRWDGCRRRGAVATDRHDYLPPNWVAAEPPTFLFAISRIARPPRLVKRIKNDSCFKYR